MKFFRFCLHKHYFEKGYGLTNYIKYLIALFGLSSLNVKSTMLMASGYSILCYFVGRWWYTSKAISAEIEVGNRVNPFVKEMRKYTKN